MAGGRKQPVKPGAMFPGFGLRGVTRELDIRSTGGHASDWNLVSWKKTEKERERGRDGETERGLDREIVGGRGADSREPVVPSH